MSEKGASENRQGPVTPPSLLMRIRDASDTESWRTFETIYGPIIRAFCRSQGVQVSDIDDITQEVLAKVVHAIREFEYDPKHGRFRSWLATITANKLKDFVRKRNRHSPQFMETLEQLAAKPEQNKAWSSLFVRRIFNAACERVRPQFEEKTWRCFEATWRDNIPPTEVAEQLGIKVRAVYVNKSRVSRRLEEEIKMLSDDFPVIE